MTSKDEFKKRILAGSNIPNHIAIIMDGNGRWAKSRDLKRTVGHQSGVESVRKIVRAAGEIDLRYLTLYTFSIENWKRPRDEVTAIMDLLFKTAKSELQELLENNVKMITTGNLDRLPAYSREALKEVVGLTSHNTGLTLNLAINYSGRREIVEAARKIAKEIIENKIDPATIDENLFASHLQTNGLPDPDLMIRTSGEKRLSNFLLWQASYAEFYVTDVLWPDFDEIEFYRSIIDFQGRERRFGGCTEQVSESKGTLN